MRVGFIETVMFDAVGTLIFPDPPVAVAYERAGRRFGSRLSADEIEPRFRHALASSDEGQPCTTSEAQEQLRWRRIVHDVFVDVSDTDGLFETLWDHFACPESWGVYSDVTPAWKRLASRALRIGIASNFDSRLAAICRARLPMAGRDRLFVSSEVGYRKPSRDFFSTVERALGTAAHRMMLVGDDHRRDYDGAISAGWQAVLLNRNAPSANTIESLEQLTEVFL